MTKKKKAAAEGIGPKSKKKVTRSPMDRKDEPMGEDGRATRRVPVQLLVDYRTGGGSYLFDFCRDLGTGGVFIETQEPLPQGSSVDLTFTIPDSKETLRASGEVIWVQDRVQTRQDLTPGMGVQFSRFGKDDRRLLEEFVQRYVPDTANTDAQPSAKQPKQAG